MQPFPHPIWDISGSDSNEQALAEPIGEHLRVAIAAQNTSEEEGHLHCIICHISFPPTRPTTLLPKSSMFMADN